MRRSSVAVFRGNENASAAPDDGCSDECGSDAQLVCGSSKIQVEAIAVCPDVLSNDLKIAGEFATNINLRKNFVAADLFRRLCTSISSMLPSWSTARHK